jgi:alkylation response protein AidB-like acyl-CoA dehydrogenase
VGLTKFDLLEYLKINLIFRHF